MAASSMVVPGGVLLGSEEGAGCPHPSPPPRAGEGVSGLDLADEVERGGQGLRPLLPLGRADLARMGGDVLRGLYLAQQLPRVAADAAGGDLDDLDLALGVDHEG